jgi:hypothetical protein
MNIIELADKAKAEVITTTEQDGFESPEYVVTVWAFDQHQLQTFADLIIKQHEADNPVIITDNTQTIANMEAKIAELEADIAIKQEWMDAMEKSNDRLNNALEIAVEALERIVLITPYDVKPCRIATEALNKIRSE